MRRRIAALVLPAVLFCGAARAGLRAEFRDTLEDDVAHFRETVADDPLDEDAYFTMVIAMELKGAFDGGLGRFAEFEKKLAKPGETVVHHRLAAALRHRGHEEEALYVDDESSRENVVVNETVSGNE